ncbi:hypothetical protein MFIFM68171_06620 [Madurella fahalii]|uniref:Cell wall mannoprotein PIR1-like C-terminal domain-containing protein n=1 Tax=Madurella fahalii TaxID=1157608 RepID=A0ABQ0GFT5_9PEZI
MTHPSKDLKFNLEFVAKLCLILGIQLASIGRAGATWVDGHQGCGFTLSSTGSFPCAAGQLSDGQIRLNGSESIATFYIADGKITDSAGRGCIITETPITQVQCDEGKPPVQGFSIDANNVLLWKGSPHFSACPATDTEYNIYVDPNFGQAKCFGITLTASGCGAPPPTSSCPAASTSTITHTDTVTSTVLSVSTMTSFVSLPCSSAAPNVTTSSSSSRNVCHRCTASPSTASGSGLPGWSTVSGMASSSNSGI